MKAEKNDFDFGNEDDDEEDDQDEEEDAGDMIKELKFSTEDSNNSILANATEKQIEEAAAIALDSSLYERKDLDSSNKNDGNNKNNTLSNYDSLPTSPSGGDAQNEPRKFDSQAVNQARAENPQQTMITREIPSYHKHLDEDVTTAEWAAHKKHIFIFSNAGKPIFSRYGNPEHLSTLTGVMQAMVSFVTDDNDTLKEICAGARKFVFVLKGSLYFVSISGTTEPTEDLVQQLEYLYLQVISILTEKIQNIFEKKSNFDLRNLLGGTDNCIYSLIHNMSNSLAYSFGSISCLKLPKMIRQQIGEVLTKTRTPSLL